MIGEKIKLDFADYGYVNLFGRKIKIEKFVDAVLCLKNE